MKTLFDGTMEIITPCFCAGADQSKAEIRAPSIRGELRWWFRALGGTRQLEAEVFGSIKVTKGERVISENQASTLIVRVSDLRKTGAESGQMPSNHRFFVKTRLDSGSAAMIPAGWSFRLQILQAKHTSCDDLIDFAVRCFMTLGGLGLRSNRGLGAVQTMTKQSDFQSLENDLCSRGFEVFTFPVQQSALDALVVLEEQIKSFREQEGVQKDSNNAMGFVQRRKRHASCLRTRPLKMENETFLPIMFYSEAAMGNVTGLRSKLKAHFA
ncbi:type III-B CRISPR module RAMP protein Cmr1 [Verrucomicrobia bacterium S94]|nr:type III-B CRISPR module RAMP protein Cmr1 [Verrucomicrobia bacterium S94]